MKRKWIRKALKFLVFSVVAVAVLGAVIMGLWNWLMPGIFGWSLITFWQALGLLVLSRILFGRFGGPGRGIRGRHRMMERWRQMTPEEREQFSRGVKDRRCGSEATGPAM